MLWFSVHCLISRRAKLITQSKTANMKRKSYIWLLSVAAFIYIISFISFTTVTFQDSVDSVTLAERFLGLGAKQGGVKNTSRFFIQNGNLRVTQSSKLLLLELLKASECQEKPPYSEYFGHRWMNTTEAKDEFVYSAYNDGDTIRVLGATVIFRSAQPARFCKIWYKNVNKGDKFSFYVVRAQLTMIPEDHGTK